MERTQKYNEETLGNGESNYLPAWIQRVLDNSHESEMFEGEHNTDACEMSNQIARWNLLITHELIRQGLWTPTSENLKILRKLNLKYNISPMR